MALTATIYKATIQLSHIDANIYDEVNLTIAKHPSETEERMLYRLMAYLYCYQDRLEFTKGISSTDEPDIWLKDYSGDIELWIELGLPDVKRIKQALSRSGKVIVFTYQPTRHDEWSQKIQKDLGQNNRFCFMHLIPPSSDELVALLSKSMELTCIIEDGLLTLATPQSHVQVKILTPSVP